MLDAGAAAWERYADALLTWAVADARRRWSGPVESFAGLAVTDADIDRLLGGSGPASRPDDDAAVSSAADALHADPEHTFFGHLVRSAVLDPADVEVLALVAAVELDADRQRVVGYVRLEPAVAWALAGNRLLDPALPVGARIEVAPITAADAVSFVLVTGGDRTTRRWRAIEALGGGATLVTPMPTDADGWEAVVRQATLAGVAVVVEVEGGLPREARRVVEDAARLSWALSSRDELPLDALPQRPWREESVEAAPAPPEVWAEVISVPDHQGRRLDREQLELVSRALAGLDGDVDAAVRRLASGHLDRLATRIRPRRRWDDLVLPDEQMAGVREIATRYRHRGTVFGDWGYQPLPTTGTVALFAGPSGTGKTLAAEVISADLGLDLYKLDLSSVVSKYIGETEKNLEQVFVAAEAADVVLFFDEADSLFGRRSEVSDSHDRYANIEVAYLLQRLERHEGLVILATNLQKNIDDAFLRRIHVAVEFPLPDPPERRTIWERSLPAGAPVGELDLAFLAERFRLTGGSIRNVTLAAAFQAAELGSAITMELVVGALRRELAKLGRLVTEDEFGPWFDTARAPRASGRA